MTTHDITREILKDSANHVVEPHGEEYFFDVPDDIIREIVEECLLKDPEGMTDMLINSSDFGEVGLPMITWLADIVWGKADAFTDSKLKDPVLKILDSEIESLCDSMENDIIAHFRSLRRVA